MHDIQFMHANQVLVGVLRKLRKEGKDCTKHKSAIEEGDFQKMYESKTLNNDTPSGLQKKVFVELSIHFG